MKSKKFYVIGVVLCVIIMGGAIILLPFAYKFYSDTLVPSAKKLSVGKLLSSVKNSSVAEYVGFSSRKEAFSQQMSQGMASMPQEQPDRIPLQLNLAKQQLLGIQTSKVEYQSLEKVIRTVGRIDHDESKIAAISLKVGGWIGKLYADYTGKFVRKGDRLFTVYSPDLVSTQEEYLLALRTREKVKHSRLQDAVEGADRLVESSRNRLLLWDVSEEQILELAMSGKANTYVTFYSPVSGFVTKSNVKEGMYVKPGMTLFEVADLSTVWLYADIYEYEIPFVKLGQVAAITLPYDAARTYRGQITYIYPHLEPETRTVKVRLEFGNPDLALKPQMYAHVEIKVKEGRKLSVPDSAVLHSGIRNIVFIARENGLFEPREVKLGAKVDTHYEVLEGLSEGERIVTAGNFLLDSESRLMAATGGMKGMMSMIGMGDAPMQGATMGGMGGMPGMEGMGSMPGMESTKGMQGMGGMEEMEEVKKPMKGRMNSTGGMRGMGGMSGMEGMEEIKERKR